MINRRVLSAAAIVALVLPFAVPTESSAQNYMAPPRTGSFSGVVGQGGANLGRGWQGQQNRAAVGAPQARSGNWQGSGGNWQGNRGGNWNGGSRNYRGGGYGGGYIPGAVAGAVIGGAVAANSYGYYGGPGYYNQGYYDDGYYDEGAVAAVPGDGGDEAYCRQTYRSYDPRSGTYLGNDGQRHPCP
jgi:hypothetical protein